MLDCTTDHEAVQYQPEVLYSLHNGKNVFTRQPGSYITTMNGFAPR